MRDASYPPVPVVRAGAGCRCPRCGRGKLFEGLLSVVEHCPVCGLRLAGHDSGDGPAVFVVLVLGILMVGAMWILELSVAPPMWVHMVLWPPVVLGGAILLLRPCKAMLVALQYRLWREEYEAPD